jgi:hypothetical protein
VIEHGGGIEGFNTQLAYYPDDKLTVAVLGNINGGAPANVASKLAAVVHGEKVVLPSERTEIKVSPSILATYVGTYELRPGFNLMFTLEGDQLMTQATGQPKFPIFAETETKFFLKVVDAQVEFKKDDKGKVNSLVLHQGGQDIPGRRISDTVAAQPERKAITIDPKVLATYTGTYGLGPGFDMVVTLEGDQLMEQATGQPKFPIFPETETKFFLKVVDAQIDFQKDAGGKVTGLVLHQGGRDIKAARQ